MQIKIIPAALERTRLIYVLRQLIAYIITSSLFCYIRISTYTVIELV